MDEEHIDKPTKPGQYLAYEREKRGFTVEDIAGKLRLSPRTIRALEEETHDKLPELVYVRGYIRSYCRLLHIDSVPVLDMYTANIPQETDQLLEDLSSSSPLNERQQKYIIFWGSVAVAFIFLALVIGWWQENRPTTYPVSESSVSQEEAAPAFVDEPSVSQEETAPAFVDEPSVSQETAPASVDNPSVSQEEAAPASVDNPSVSQEEAAPASVDEPPVSQETAPASVDEPSFSQEEAAPAFVDEPPVSQEEAAAPASAGEASVSQEEAAPASAGEPSVSQEDVAEQPETPDIPSPQEEAPPVSDIETINVPNDEVQPAVADTEADAEPDNGQFDVIDDALQPVTLVVMSTGESWARVRDGGGDIFIHRILPTGYNKIFMVNLPLKFEFGNAYQVSIMIDGRDYDMSSYIKSNRVAVFEVTELP